MTSPPKPPRFATIMFFIATATIICVEMFGARTTWLWVLFPIALVLGVVVERWRKDYERWCRRQQSDS